MKILFVAVNSRFVQTNLAVRYLKKSCADGGYDADLIEFHINQPLEQMLDLIVRQSADVVGFSCYLFNIEIVRKLASALKKVSPQTVALFGGPEMTEHTDPGPADYILTGEGEEAVVAFLRSLEKGRPAIPEERRIGDLSALPDPYADGIGEMKDRILYYESSRGCPFACRYCLSARTGGVRYLPLERVKRELKRFSDEGAWLVKFVDRTFNSDPARAREIFAFLMELNSQTRWHFEIEGHLLDGETAKLLSRAPKGLFQFEIGVQSTCREALLASGRNPDWTALRENIAMLMEKTDIPVHLDLIAGLPGEGLRDFEKSFNDVYALLPDRLQLGFLKLIPGSALRENAKELGIVYREEPPYEVLFTRQMSYSDLCRLKDIEDILERYYNAHLCPASLSHLAMGFDAPFGLYDACASAWRDMGWGREGKSAEKLFSFLDRIGGHDGVLRQCLALDWFSTQKSAALPPFLAEEAEIERVDRDSLPGDIPPGRRKRARVVRFSGNVLEYAQGKPWREEVTRVLFIDRDQNGDAVRRGLTARR